MFNIGGGELLVIGLIALIVLGPQRLPEAARTIGRVMGEVRRISSGFQSEVREAFQDADTPRPRIARGGSGDDAGPEVAESRPLAAAVQAADAPVDRDDGDGDTVDPDPDPDPGADDGDEVDRPLRAVAVAPAVLDALDDITGDHDEPEGPGPDGSVAAADAAPPEAGDERAAS